MARRLSRVSPDRSERVGVAAVAERGSGSSPPPPARYRVALLRPAPGQSPARVRPEGLTPADREVVKCRRRRGSSTLQSSVRW